jgi:TM2 domain-containing membrane protein YozV
MGQNEWYVKHNSRTVGPLNAKQLRHLAKTQQITAETPVSADGTRWSTAGKVAGLIATQSTAIAEIEPTQQLSQTVVVHAPNTISIPEFVAPKTKLCPFCAEEIALQAVKCRHCGEFLDTTLREAARLAATPVREPLIPQAAPAAPVIIHNHNNNVAHAHAFAGARYKRWSRLVAGVCSLLIPGLGQIYKGQVFNGLAWFIVTLVGYVCFVIPGLALHGLCVLGAMSGDPYR